MPILLIGPITRSNLRFTYPMFDGEAVTLSFPYTSLEQARYARDREAGTRLETTEAFDGAVGPPH